ncbi:sigma 54-interacting transcriptional regulator [Deltaproteobacteria bacterium]|nr:sigma 54-interacting transcriptional regulator [Deltaproteobacteria bacterium]
MANLKAKDIMTPAPFCLKETDTAREAALAFQKKGIEGAPVIDGKGNLSGLLTKAQLSDVVANDLDLSTPIKHLMVSPVITVSADTPVVEMLRKGLIIIVVLDSRGNLAGIATPYDVLIALRKNFEQSHDKLKTILDSSYNAIIAVDAKGHVTTWNLAAERMTGISSQKAIGKVLSDIIPGAELLKVLRTGRGMHGQKVQIGHTLAISNKTPIIKSGEVVGAVSVLQDISDLESIAAELKVTKELNKELDAIIDSVFEGLYITDGDANTLRINKAYTRLTGIEAEEVLGKNMRELVAKGYYSQSVSLLVLEKREPVTILHKIKGTQECMISGIPIFNEKNEIFKVVTTVRDLSGLNKLKNELKNAESISKKYHLEVQHLRHQQMKQSELIEHGPEMKKILERAHRAAEVNSTVLVMGETGVGKEVVAKYIHKNSPRNNAPFITVNCASIPESLLESELFGYEKGAFTGAQSQGKPGMFELADTGTIFLDEIGDLPLNMQAKLLRVLQDKEVSRIGGTGSIKLDLRIIAASNQDLEKMVSKGTFREDLYYRLKVIPMKVPPLRARQEEIPFLAKHFLDIFNKQYNRSKSFTESAIDAFVHYAWPGNVRELKNLVERLVVIGDADQITLGQLSAFKEEDTPFWKPPYMSGGKVLLKDAVSTLERHLVSKALSEGGSSRKAAKSLGVSQPTIIRKAQKYGISFNK